MKKRRIISYVLLILVLVSLISTLIGCTSTEKKSISVPNVEEDVFIYDEDNIIDESTEESLNKMLVELEEETRVEFAVISVKSLNGMSIEEYANQLFNKLGIGKKGEDNGLLLLMSKSDKKVRLEVGRGLEEILNDSKCGRILDNYFVPYRDKNEYTKATKKTVEAVLTILSEEYKVNIYGLTKNKEVLKKDNELPPLRKVVLLIIIIVIAIIIVGFTDGGGYSSGGYYGGSSGGFSGGGGSFGGGFSGGGGASR